MVAGSKKVAPVTVPFSFARVIPIIYIATQILMSRLTDKYRNGTITPDELKTLAQQVAQQGDAELAQELAGMWAGEIDDTHVATEQVEVVKQRIDRCLFGAGSGAATAPVRRLKLYRWVAVAASVLVLLLMGTTVYYYRQAAGTVPHEVTFATAANERGSVTLPDGTVVMLNGNSRITFDSSLFGRMQRAVTFSGEGYFTVAKDSACPFVVTNTKLYVRVLGTRFDLRARPGDSAARLALDEGGVLMATADHSASERIAPGQVAQLDYASGHISVKSWSRYDNIESWRTRQLVFTQAPLAHVLRSVEGTYGISVAYRQLPTQADRFDGTLPTDNLYEAMRIVTIAYGLSYTVEGRQVILKPSEK